MSLGTKQRLFARNVARLLDKAHELGFEVTLGDAFRDPRAFGEIGTRVAYGHPKSAHKLRLAIDLNLFKDGKFLQSSEDHEPLGEWWESLHPENRWGGRFQDGNHYSMIHDGVM